MPTYQYRCADCGHRFDAVQSFSDDALTTCPECGGELRKVYGSVGVVFKGSGFYRTDSRANNGKSRGGKEAAAAKSGEGGGSDGSKSGSSGDAAKPAAAASGSGSGSSSGSSSGRSSGSSSGGSSSSGSKAVAS